jgi:hypothetical protein
MKCKAIGASAGSILSKEEDDGNNIDRSTGADSDRSIANLAIQQRMGLLPQWWAGSRVDHCADFSVARPYLKTPRSTCFYRYADLMCDRIAQAEKSNKEREIRT